MIKLYLTFNCNLRCKYCYFNKESNLTKEVISTEALNKFLDFLDSIGHFEHGQLSERVMFIGGEPLLYPDKILEFIKIFQVRYPKMKFQFEITSNLTLYEPRIYQKKELHFVVSLDGTKETHDKNRIFPDGSGSFDKVIKNLKELVKYKKEISTTYTYLGKPNNFIKSVDFISNISKDVFWDIEIRHALFELNESNLDIITKKYEELINYYLEKSNDAKINFSIKHIKAALMLMRNLKDNIKAQTCGAGFSYFVLHPNGDVWPCQIYFSLKKRKIGNIFENSFDEMKKSLDSLALIRIMLKHKAKESTCNCPKENICDKPICIALYETNNYQCHPENRLSTLLLFKLQEYLQSKLPPEVLNKMIYNPALDHRYEILE
jgi:uncharacterized protein